MAYGLAGAHREELKDKPLLSLRTELRSYRLNGSGMNKIVRSKSATPCSIKRSNVHAPTSQSSLRRRRHFSAADTDLTCHRQACLERSTAYDTHAS